MTVFVCVDERGGMTFNSRRQSRDIKVIEDVLSHAQDSLIYITDFSEDLFESSSASVISVPDPLSCAGCNSFVFIESVPLLPSISRINTLVIYCWNRAYPYDTQIDVDPIKEGFRLTRVTEFEGKSHEKIRKEVYER